MSIFKKLLFNPNMEHNVVFQFNPEIFDNTNTLEKVIKRIKKCKNKMFYQDDLKTYVKIVSCGYHFVDFEGKGKEKDLCVYFIFGLNVQDINSNLDEESKQYLRTEMSNLILKYDITTPM
jgi:hypothetical protein